MKKVDFLMKMEEYNKLETLCSPKPISACIRDAIDYWLLMVESGRLDPDPPTYHKFPIRNRKIVWFMIDKDKYNKFVEVCRKVGYEAIAYCLRDCVRLWIQNQKKGV